MRVCFSLKTLYISGGSISFSFLVMFIINYNSYNLRSTDKTVIYFRQVLDDARFQNKLGTITGLMQPSDVLFPARARNTSSRTTRRPDTSTNIATTHEELHINGTVPRIFQPRILCWILCDPIKLEISVKYVQNTWTRRCDVRLFISSSNNSDFPTIGVDVPSGRDHIAAKAKAAWLHIYTHYYHKADYFVKADPDTYMIVENLRKFLSQRDPNKPEYMGHLMKLPRTHFLYAAGGPGIVLSREALRRLVVDAYALKNDCMPDGQGEDWKTGSCLSKVGARPVNTVDKLGRQRFVIFTINDMLTGNFPHWYFNYTINNVTKGLSCCSSSPISFHYVTPTGMLALEYYFYIVHAINRRKASPGEMSETIQTTTERTPVETFSQNKST